MFINYIKLILFSLVISLAFADECSVIKDILTQNNVAIFWSPSNSTGCCSDEIRCDNGRIVQVNFSSKGYTGSIPSSIQNLSNLQYLYATGNQLSGVIPKEIAIPNLQFIDLSNNQLEGEIPSSLGEVINLQHINLSNNKLSGKVPSSFHSLQNIQVLRLSGNRQLSGELPYMSETLKECSFGSTSLCINGSRSHCTSGIKNCESTVTKQEPTPTKTEENSSTPDNNNNDTPVFSPTLGPEDLAESNKSSKNDKLIKWIALGFIILLVLCIVILFLICCKRHYKKPVVIEKPVPGHSTTEIFSEEYLQSYDGNEDPDASIQIHSLTKPHQHTVVTVNDEINNSQSSSYDESSQYESLGGKSSNYGSLHSINHGRSPKNSNSIINQSGAYSTTSLNRNHIPGTPVESIEQDLGDMIINNGSIISDNTHMVTANMITPPPKRISTNISSYTKSQSSPNLVRMNRYSVGQPSPPNGAGKRRLTNVSAHNSTFNDSPKLTSVSSSLSIDEKRTKHSSIPYPVSPFAVKSSTVNTNQRKTYDTKRLSSSNDEAIHHNTIHVVNSRKSIPYLIDKSPTTVTKITNYSENTTTSNYSNSNSIHSSTPIMSKNKNRTSLPPMNSKKPSILTKFSSQNSMNVSPLVNSMDMYDVPSASDINDQYRVSANKTSINPSTISSNTINSLNDNGSKVNILTINSNNTSHQDHSYNSDDNGQHQINTSLDTDTSNNSSLNNTTIKNTTVYTNNNNINNLENLTEKIYVEPSEIGKIHNSDKTSSVDTEEYKQYDQEIYNEDYEYENIPEDLRQQIEEPQPPNYDEVFSESMYSPYVDPNNDEAIRMQLEMRRIEERQTRMEYLQRQIDNPELSNAQRQKYIDALDRLMLE
ncbi:hypothetical protein PIROE2DRAFT_58999 [Piromyces sp. E2]|nr:hypothetical protein PIROE2DRAFT_58999 [Piromyces sp. E2]|eukprot:OUM66997.1 hypothetical protein PIROE2DRAFT_58999 [Piromyces sp. E2]